MYPLKSSVEGPATLWQDFNQSIHEDPQDAAIQDFLNLPSDMESFMALDSIEEVKEKDEAESMYTNILQDIAKDVGILEEMEEKVLTEEFSLESNQSLIDEVESYLQHVSGGSPTMVDEYAEQEDFNIESNWTDIKQTDVIADNKVIVDSPAVSADKILNALTTGNVETAVDEGVNLNAADLQNAITTSVVGDNGENVIIIIAQAPSPAVSPVPVAVSPYHHMVLSPESSVAMSPAASSFGGSCGSDYEWSPSPASSTAGGGKAPTQRKKYQRRVPTTPPSGPYPKEKTERKKAQNRTAAYKYREKKKLEQEAVDDELNRLADRNKVLNNKLSEVEVQLKYMKKLMTELGLNTYM